jgi:predicted membrane protein
MKRDFATILVGALFLVAGIAIGGSMLGYFDLRINAAGWWTVFIIVPALISIVNGGVNLGNLIMLAVGVILLLDQQGVLPAGFSWRLVLPAILLVIGVQLLFGGTGFSGFRGKRWCCGPSGTEKAGGATGSSAGARDAGRKTASAVFGEQNVNYGNDEFFGGSYSAFCGSCVVNLSAARIVGDVVITVSAFMGGIEIILPANVSVISHVTPLLGGCEIKYPSSSDPAAPKVIVNGAVSLGGVTVK